MNSFVIQQNERVPDEIGGHKFKWTEFKPVEGYIDLITGTDLNTVQNAFVEESTHILIIPEFTTGITDKMRVVEKVSQRYYSITYADDPVGVGHHNEVYCKFGGVLSGEERI